MPAIRHSFDSFRMHWDHELLSSFAVTNHRRTILPLLGERAGVRAVSLQPRYEALTNRFMKSESTTCRNCNVNAKM